MESNSSTPVNDDNVATKSEEKEKTLDVPDHTFIPVVDDCVISMSTINRTFLPLAIEDVQTKLTYRTSRLYDYERTLPCEAKDWVIMKINSFSLCNNLMEYVFLFLGGIRCM